MDSTDKILAFLGTVNDEYFSIINKLEIAERAINFSEKIKSLEDQADLHATKVKKLKRDLKIEEDLHKKVLLELNSVKLQQDSIHKTKRVCGQNSLKRRRTEIKNMLETIRYVEPDREYCNYNDPFTHKLCNKIARKFYGEDGYCNEHFYEIASSIPSSSSTIGE